MALAHAPRGIRIVLVSPSPPPQAAQGLVRFLSRGRGTRPNVVAFVTIRTGQRTIEFANVGSGEAHNIRYFVLGADQLSDHGAIGDLHPGESHIVHIESTEVNDPLRCIWTCQDAPGRLHIWSRHGKHKRLRRTARMSDIDCFRLMYPDTPGEPL